MTVETAPSLDELNNATTAAWLWDGARLRIVWANAAAVAFFGCESLFDLIDMPFDEADPGAGRVAELARTARTGEKSLSAHFEVCVAVTREGPRVLGAPHGQPGQS